MKYRMRLLGITLTIFLIGCSASVPANVDVPTSVKSEAERPVVLSVSPSPSNLGQMLPIAAEVQIGGQRIWLEVTRTPQEQQIGLMYRTSLPPDRGMLFSFDPPRPVGFWMRNVKIPLDMVFLRDGEVQAIAANVPPCTTTTCPTYGPETSIDQVIELRGGRAAELGLQVGDQVNVKFLDQETTPSNSSEY